MSLLTYLFHLSLTKKKVNYTGETSTFILLSINITFVRGVSITEFIFVSELKSNDRQKKLTKEIYTNFVVFIIVVGNVFRNNTSGRTRGLVVDLNYTPVLFYITTNTNFNRISA